MLEFVKCISENDRVISKFKRTKLIKYIFKGEL